MSDDLSHRLRPLEQIRDEALAKRDKLVRDICAAESGPHGGRGSRGVQVDTPQKGLAYVQGRVDADYRLPKLHALFTELGLHGVADVPPWKGEPKTDVEALQALDALLTCCKEAIGLPSKPPPAKLTAVEQALILLFRNPNQSNRVLARQIGCHPSALSDDRIRRLRQAQSGRDLLELWRAEVGPLKALPEMPGATNYHEAAAALDVFQRAVEKLSDSSPSETPPASKENPNDKRDKFAYTSLKAGKSLQVIKNKINNRRTWEPLESVQGVSAAAKRYAERHSLPWPIVKR